MLVGNGKGLANDPLLKRICRKCGESMTIRNNRQIYCAACSKENRLVKERERKRRAREKKRGSINFEVDNSEDIRKKCKMEDLGIGRDDPQHVKVNPECGYDVKTKAYEMCVDIEKAYMYTSDSDNPTIGEEWRVSCQKHNEQEYLQNEE